MYACMYKEDLALKTPQRMICYMIPTNKTEKKNNHTICLKIKNIYL